MKAVGLIRSEVEIKKRIRIANLAFKKMGKILNKGNLSFETRLRILKCYVWSTLLYECESWTISKSMQARLEAAEMWFLRRMCKIKWKDRVTNKEALRKAGTS